MERVEMLRVDVSIVPRNTLVVRADVVDAVCDTYEKRISHLKKVIDILECNRVPNGDVPSTKSLLKTLENLKTGINEVVSEYSKIANDYESCKRLACECLNLKEELRNLKSTKCNNNEVLMTLWLTRASYLSRSAD